MTVRIAGVVWELVVRTDSDELNACVLHTEKYPGLENLPLRYVLYRF